MKVFFKVIMVVLVFLSANAQAKTLFIGINGGIDMFFQGDDANSDYYVPHKRFAGKSPEEIASMEGGSGLDALEVYLEQNLNDDLLSLMARESTTAQTIADLVERAVNQHPRTVYIAGYSAGGGVALGAARELYHRGITVDGLVWWMKSLWPVRTYTEM